LVGREHYLQSRLLKRNILVVHSRFPILVLRWEEEEEERRSFSSKILRALSRGSEQVRVGRGGPHLSRSAPLRSELHPYSRRRRSRRSRRSRRMRRRRSRALGEAQEQEEQEDEEEEEPGIRRGSICNQKRTRRLQTDEERPKRMECRPNHGSTMSDPRSPHHFKQRSTILILTVI
jgi:hypothetical protein